jgi:hypothetical protein
MKKTILSIAIALISTSGFSQVKRVDLSKKQIGPLECNFIQRIDLEKKDTSCYFYGGFQNAKYTTIVDIGGVFISNKEDFESIIKQLKEVKSIMEGGEKVDYTSGPFALYDFSNKMYINDDRKYTTLTVGQVTKFIEFLESGQSYLK